MPSWSDDVSWNEISDDYLQDAFINTASERLLEDMADDAGLYRMFDTAFFDMDASNADRIAARDDLREYLMDEYGLDIDDVFDWEAWREAYAQ